MRRLAGHIALWTGPLLVLLAAEYRRPGLLTTPPWFTYLALFTLVGSTAMAFYASIVGRRHYGEVAIGLSLQAVGLILLFALFYRDTGLIVPGGGKLMPPTRSTSA